MSLETDELEEDRNTIRVVTLKDWFRLFSVILKALYYQIKGKKNVR